MKIGDLVKVNKTGKMGVVIDDYPKRRRTQRPRWVVKMLVSMTEAVFQERDLEILNEA
jgi:hypothetical protein